MGLEGVSSGYWTQTANLWSGLVSHYGSIPSPSAPLHTSLTMRSLRVGLNLIRSQGSYWKRLITPDDYRGFAFCDAHPTSDSIRIPRMPASLSSRLAPIVLPDCDGHDVALGSLWRDRPAVIIFLRHYG